MTHSNAFGPRPIGYQAHIDGLRAVAVLAVIANHIDRSLLPSGYLGVDVFFVISGFVITASLRAKHGDSFRAFLQGFSSGGCNACCRR